MKTTQYFHAMRARQDRAVIREEWIERAIHNPIQEQVQTDSRIRRWTIMEEMGGRYLRVAPLSDRETVHNAVFRPKLYAMKIQYFADTDTLYIKFRGGCMAETGDLDENTLLDVDAQGNICAVTVEHVSERAGIPQFYYERIAA